MIASIGAGPAPIPHRRLTAARLASAIKFSLTPDVLYAAQIAAERIKSDTGAVAGAQSFHRHLPLDSMRCEIDPTLLARFYVQEWDIKLSKEVANVLVNHGKLSPESLLTFRYKKWDPDSTRRGMSMRRRKAKQTPDSSINNSANSVASTSTASQGSDTSLNAAAVEANTSSSFSGKIPSKLFFGRSRSRDSMKSPRMSVELSPGQSMRNLAFSSSGSSVYSSNSNTELSPVVQSLKLGNQPTSNSGTPSMLSAPLPSTLHPPTDSSNVYSIESPHPVTVPTSPRSLRLQSIMESPDRLRENQSEPASVTRPSRHLHPPGGDFSMLGIFLDRRKCLDELEILDKFGALCRSKRI
jgi:hypothetical protein